MAYGNREASHAKVEAGGPLGVQGHFQILSQWPWCY